MKPAAIIYSVDNAPSAGLTFMLGLQHVCIIGITMVLPVLLVQTMGGSTQEAMFYVSMSMLAAGIGGLLQSLRSSPLGSGYLCPQVTGPAYLPASVAAGGSGGLMLVMGMTMAAGLFETLFSRVVKRLRFLFPTEVTGLIVTMVALSVIKLASLSLLGMEKMHDVPDGRVALTGFATLAVMIGLNVWSRGKLKLFGIVIGMAFGYGVAIALGILGKEALEEFARQPLVWMPLTQHPGWSFDWKLLLPFSVAALCSSLKCVGDLTTCQKINDAEWKRPDINNISKGLLADGTGCFTSGLLGGYGLSTSSSNVGLSIATGATSRRIALPIAGILAILAFCPKLVAVFAIMPKPVVGATMVFALSFTAVAGLQIIMSRMMDNRKTFVVGTSMILGLMADVVPQAFHHLPASLKVLFSSSLTTATLTALVLNLVLRIGVHSKAQMEISDVKRSSRQVYEFMQHQGSAWGARKEVIQQATTVLSEFVECLLPQVLSEQRVVLLVSFDEYKLQADILYKGRPFDPPQESPLQHCLHEGGDLDMQTMLSWRIIRHYIQGMKMLQNGKEQRLRLTFEH